MAKKVEEIKTDYNTKFHQKVMKDLADLGYVNIPTSSIAFIVENDSDDVVVDYNAMSTGLRYNKKDIDIEEIVPAGFKYWPVWNFNSK